MASQNRIRFSKDRRQVEIIGLVLAPERPTLSVNNLCEHFGVEVATINRDLTELRSRGIPIHSGLRQVRLDRKLTDKETQALLSLYVASVGPLISLPKNISLLVKSKKSAAIPLLTRIIDSIENRQEINISYYKKYEGIQVTRILQPHDLIPTGKDWRLVALCEGVMKQFLVENIITLARTGRRFVRNPEYNGIDYFRKSFSYFRGTINDLAEIRFSKAVASMVKSEVWDEDQEIVEAEDGSVILRFPITAIEPVGDWLMGWGGEAIVLNPPELKSYVLQRANDILRANL